MNFFVCKKNRWFSATILNIGMKKHIDIADTILYAKFYETRAEAEHALKVLTEHDPLHMYKGQWQIKEYRIEEV